MSDICATAAGADVRPCGFDEGSTLGFGDLQAGAVGFDEVMLAEVRADIAAKYPPGWAFEGVHDETSILGRQVTAVAKVFYDVEAIACGLLPEWICSTASKTIPTWNADYGLPDDCGINDLCAKLAAIGGQDCGYFQRLGATLGYDLCCEDIPPEIQAGAWCLGVDPLPPEPKYGGGGVDLGVMQLGECSGEGSDDPCADWHPPSTPFECGGAAPWTLDYAGTAYHWRVGTSDPLPDVALLGYYALAGNWLLGVAELCEPPTAPVLCFIQRYRPAHVVPVPFQCQPGGA